MIDYNKTLEVNPEEYIDPITLDMNFETIGDQIRYERFKELEEIRQQDLDEEDIF